MSRIPQPQAPILLVDDEPRATQALQFLLNTNGIESAIALNDSREIMPLLARQDVEVIMLDLSMPHLGGQELLAQIRQQYPLIPVIMVTANDDLETAVQCMREGATDYVLKPLDKERIIDALRRAMELRDLRRENSRLKEIIGAEPRTPPAFAEIVTVSPKVRALFQYAGAIAPSSHPVLITGETGTGKELFARAVHQASGRKGKFVAVNTAGLDENVFADTLFGHVKGAYTGADSARAGLIEQAADGTLFLDEIADLSTSVQIKLLRLLQEREYLPLGSDRPKQTNARVLVASNQDLAKMVQAGRFRLDLYHRLRIHQIDLPALRDRREDIPVLLHHFVVQSARECKVPAPAIPDEAVTLLQNYAFPGNVRELQALVTDSVHRTGGREVQLASLKKAVGSAPVPVGVEAAAGGELIFTSTLPSLKRAADLLVNEALRRSNNNQSLAAHLLGVTPAAISKRLRKSAEPSGSGEL